MKKLIGVLIMSLLMMSLIGCPTDGGSSDPGTKTDDTEATMGYCEEILDVTLSFHHDYMGDRDGRVKIVPTYPGVPNPEKIKGFQIWIWNSDGKDYYGGSGGPVEIIEITPSTFDNDGYPLKYQDSFDFHLSFDFGGVPSVDMFKYIYLSYTNYLDDNFPDKLTFKIKFKYQWSKTLGDH